jgi:hypothetical protein
VAQSDEHVARVLTTTLVSKKASRGNEEGCLVRISWTGKFLIAVSVISLAVVAAAISGGGPARAVGTTANASATSFGADVSLSDIAASSSSSAWAVGNDDAQRVPRTILEHWNGKKWTRITKGIPVYGYLSTVAATSADNVWAAGAVETAAGPADTKSLVLHWNGKTWSQATGVSILYGSVSDLAASGNAVWAVGTIARGETESPLILHWTGGKWYLVPFNGESDRYLSSVALTEKDAAWAVGATNVQGGADTSLLFHWTGDVWRPTPLPVHGGNYDLGIAAGLTGTVWAEGNADKPFVLRLNGNTWQQVPVGLSASQYIQTFACSTGGTPWLGVNGTTTLRPLVLRWTGKTWATIAVPKSIGNVISLAATSNSNAWMVGESASGSVILHWNGKTWT